MHENMRTMRAAGSWSWEVRRLGRAEHARSPNVARLRVVQHLAAGHEAALLLGLLREHAPPVF
eukprot:scaffold231569_cov21-Tisochrysis_lutea.AAC.1